MSGCYRSSHASWFANRLLIPFTLYVAIFMPSHYHAQEGSTRPPGAQERVGIQFTGKAWSEARRIAIAQEYQRLTD